MDEQTGATARIACKVTNQIAIKDVVHDMLQLRKCFSYRIRSLALSSGYLTVIFSVGNSVHLNVKNSAKDGKKVQSLFAITPFALKKKKKREKF